MQKRTLWVTLHTHPYLFLSTYLLIITIQTHTYDIREATHFPSFSVTNRRTYREPLEFDSKTDRESDRKVMSSAKKVANAVGGKTARACDSCITKRARWYCAADDAFLCQACDSSVHSANPLARRHERVRLKTTSYNNNKSSDSSALTPSWHHGFTKKARTPRHGGKSTTHSTNYSSTPTHKSWSNHPFHLVPEEGHSEEVNSQDEEMSDEAQLLYRVPIFDPFVEAELCSPPSSVNSAGAVTDTADVVVENKGMMGSESMSMSKVVCCFNNGGVESSSSSSLQGLLATEIELAQFAADVESLLGRELENECIGMEELGLLVDNNQKEKECSVKVEHNNNNNSEEQSTEEVAVLDVASSRGGEPPFELSFDYDYDHDYDEVKKQEEAVIDDLDKQAKEDEEEEEEENHDEEKIRRKILLMLQLDYEGVITAWASEKKSPWTTPHKPNLLDHHHCMVGSSVCGTQIDHPYGEMFGLHPAVTMGDGGREARVSRYREKRRTRLFSKKIRYEVRKLNAEKRPRMKGRFVKRASFAAPPTFSLAK